MYYRVDVFVDGEWSGNALTFPTQEEAAAYAVNLARRWTAVRDWRLTEVPMEGDKS